MMAGSLGRNLYLCFAKIKRPLAPESPSTLLTPDDHSHPFLIKNYNSLFDPTFDTTSTSNSSSNDEPDFATVYASQRFFFSYPGRSNSIIESTPSSVTSTESSDNIVAPDIQSDTNTLIMNHSYDKSFLAGNCNQRHHLSFQQPSRLLKSPTVKDSVAVPTYSPDPYMDFRRSMQEMVDSCDFVDVKANQDFLHELLSCYLSLNPKSNHKFIIGAFADLLIGLLSSSIGGYGGHREEEIVDDGCQISKQCM